MCLGLLNVVLKQLVDVTLIDILMGNLREQAFVGSSSSIAIQVKKEISTAVEILDTDLVGTN